MITALLGKPGEQFHLTFVYSLSPTPLPAPPSVHLSPPPLSLSLSLSPSFHSLIHTHFHTLKCTRWMCIPVHACTHTGVCQRPTVSENLVDLSLRCLLNMLIQCSENAVRFLEANGDEILRGVEVSYKYCPNITKRIGLLRIYLHDPSQKPSTKYVSIMCTCMFKSSIS